MLCSGNWMLTHVLLASLSCHIICYIFVPAIITNMYLDLLLTLPDGYTFYSVSQERIMDEIDEEAKRARMQGPKTGANWDAHVAHLLSDCVSTLHYTEKGILIYIPRMAADFSCWDSAGLLVLRGNGEVLLQAKSSLVLVFDDASECKGLLRWPHHDLAWYPEGPNCRVFTILSWSCDVYRVREGILNFSQWC